MKPTKSNRTGKATESDNVMTPTHIAEAIVERYKPKGFVLEPARGTGNIFNELKKPKDWCEINQNRDFFDYNKKVDWIITNPPYSIYDLFLEHCFEVADNVVLLVPIAKAFKSMRVEKMVSEYGGLKEIWLMGSGTKCGFAFGFPTGCLYYKRGYKGDIKYVIGMSIPSDNFTDKRITTQNKNKPILCRNTMSKDYKTREQWQMFIESRHTDIGELEEVIKIAESLKQSLLKDK